MYSTVWMVLPSAAFQAGSTGVYLFAWNPKTLTASLSCLLLHCTYFKPCKQAKLCRMSNIQDSSEGFLIRALLNMLARLLLSRWRLPMVLPQYACGLHCSAAGWDNAVLCATGTQLQYGKMLLLMIAVYQWDHLMVLNC